VFELKQYLLLLFKLVHMRKPTLRQHDECVPWYRHAAGFFSIDASPGLLPTWCFGAGTFRSALSLGGVSIWKFSLDASFDLLATATA